ncbi:MAG: hypothetical protein M9920_04520 [Verrucomicrobiae bacterium]|nr:hypothetical protein [Verrucomicrobiae bacterium]
MKSILNSYRSHPWTKRQRLSSLLVVAVGLLFASPLGAQVYYDFDNGTDTGWMKSTEHPATITFPADSLGGKAYRLQGTPMTSGDDPSARVFAFFTNRFYTNFYAAVDVVAWDTSQDSDLVIGLIARVNGNDVLPNTSFQYSTDPLQPDAPNGITFNVRLHDYRSYTGPDNTGPLGHADQMSIWNINYDIYQSRSSLGVPVTVTQSRFRWVAGHAYRLVLTSTNALDADPATYTASIYDVNDLTTPLLSMTGDTSYQYNGGYLLTPRYGYVGVFAYKLSAGDYIPDVDVTFDNFYVGETAPATAVVAPAIAHGKPGAPQVINRTPASFKNFHPAASGIAFNATTLTTTNNIKTDAIKLYLNGVDVSSGLVVTGPATNASVSFAGLAPNVVYDARIIVEDVLGRRTTNEWTFDTFSDAYLASASVKVIESEDYDFNYGSYLNDPPASGYYDYDPIYDIGTVINAEVGYVDQFGGPGEDFFDTDGGPKSLNSQYRHYDPVGTQQGNLGDYFYGDINEVNGPLGYGVSRRYDTQRSKYANLNPTLQEYVVTRVRGGEWLNYTRQFDGSKYYNVYLRAAAGLAMPVRLDQITTGPTTNALGQFQTPSTFFNFNYRYTPLTQPGGELATINLEAVNTLRATIAAPNNSAYQDGFAMNYMVFVPAVPQVYSATTANGTYTPELNVLVDSSAKRIVVPQNGATRFYRLGWHQALTINSAQLSGGNVVLTYE